MKKSTPLLMILAAAVGFIAASRYFSDKYKKAVQAEIDSVKAAFRKEKKKLRPEMPSETAEKAKDKPELSSYVKYAKGLGYGAISDVERPAPVECAKPYVIAPDDFGGTNYELVSLTWYADGIMADEDNRLLEIDEIEETVGADATSHFGEFEEDCVYVRNDRTKRDYEILQNEQTYADVVQGDSE